jgi:hypothetical protein
VATQWNSQYYMLERLLEQKKAINLYIVENGKLTDLRFNQYPRFKVALFDDMETTRVILHLKQKSAATVLQDREKFLDEAHHQSLKQLLL